MDHHQEAGPDHENQRHETLEFLEYIIYALNFDIDNVISRNAIYEISI